MSVSSGSVAIRSANDADTDAVAAIDARHVPHGRASFETEPLNSAEMRRRRNDGVGKRPDRTLLQRGLDAGSGAPPGSGTPDSAAQYRADG